ncbi:hypothetical protein CDAR_403041 [Caerostris darwini]|uniref:Uncharacterized protein n=1 Tax=Caerostris darwini TaxID=1538125 RepID=A0AAV4WZL7_9ARAC|nr:hypothetical protein CDAR_403041 [Caerostris darwini]
MAASKGLMLHSQRRRILHLFIYTACQAIKIGLFAPLCIGDCNHRVQVNHVFSIKLMLYKAENCLNVAHSLQYCRYRMTITTADKERGLSAGLAHQALYERRYQNTHQEHRQRCSYFSVIIGAPSPPGEASVHLRRTETWMRA